ncbi:MAG: hypothetical protein WCI04_01790 [archaeon]
MADSASVLRNIHNFQRKVLKRKKPKYRKRSYPLFFAPHDAHSPLVAIAEVGPRKDGNRGGLLQILDKARKATGCGKNMRILEIGAGSGRLASHLMKTEKINPKNYVLADKEYGRARNTDEGRGWILKRNIYQQVRKGNIQTIPANIFRRPPASMKGKFQVIIVPFVSGGTTFLSFLLKNYFEKLAVGGFIVVNRANSSYYGLRTHAEQTSKTKGGTPEIFNVKRHNQAILTLERQLTRLEAKGKIQSTRPKDLFFKTKWATGKDVFLIQKIKD